MDEGEEVLALFLVPGRHSPVMLRLGPEAFDQVSVLVSCPIGLSRRLRVRPAGHRGLAALVFHCGHDCVEVRFFFKSRMFCPRSRSRMSDRSISGFACVTSVAWPGVRVSSTGSPSPFTAAWILVPNPPRQRPHCWSAWPPIPSDLFVVWAPHAQRWVRATVESKISPRHRGLARLQTPRSRCPSAPSGRNVRASRAAGHRFEQSTARCRKTGGGLRSLVPVPSRTRDEVAGPA